MRSTFAVVTLTSTLLFAPRAAEAQSPPPANAPVAVPPKTGEPSKVDVPTIEVNDPLLAPIAPAPHMVASFRDALSLVSTRSTELEIARQQIERARGLARQALAEALPSLDARGTVTHHFIRETALGRTVPETPIALASLTVVQPLLVPRAWYAIGTTDLRVKSAELGVDDKRRTVLAQVADAIVGVFTAERVAEINRVGLRSSLMRLDLAQRKTRLGDGTRLDVLRAEQDAAAAKGTLIAGDEALRKTREALGLVLGSSDGYGVPPTISLDEIDRSLAGVCTQGSIETRPDVVAARTDLEAAKRGVTDAKLAFSPNALVSSTASVSTEPMLVDQHVAWSIQGVLSIPLWEGGARYGAMRSAQATAAEQKARVEATLRGATLEVNQTLRAVGVADQARRIAEQGRDLGREAARLAERAFTAGVGTSFDLVDAGRREREAELELALREFQLIKARLGSLLATATCSY